MEQHKGIFLESGTNELEIVEFCVGQNKFGINVLKVKEIIQPVKVTNIPHSHPNVEGIIDIRGEIVPVVNLGTALGLDLFEDPRSEKFIVTEFNQLKVVFHVHAVTQIHRISWDEIEKPAAMYQGLENQVTGVVKIHDEMVFLLDFEKIVVEINPESGIHVDQVKKIGPRNRSTKKLVVVEDSPLLRKLLQETLNRAGFSQIEFFENGKEVFSYLQTIVNSGKAIEDEVQLVITDIEMPQMDGHHLTKKIKEDQTLSILPVIIFSSLITSDLRHKGEKVGANGQISKPEIVKLISKIDEVIL
ncbi:chemotaxis protein [uncultured Metabacillus sp.]|uniref:chemotaxis protein n=1 Tax=uncultured Metabacillus sp. TaxID=2860135 RepID=UPI002622B0D7|nr:chemotaxis protein [uncultured Metabacillus sp.]